MGLRSIYPISGGGGGGAAGTGGTGTLILFDTHTAELDFTTADRPILAVDATLPNDCKLIHFNFGRVGTGGAKSGENDTITRAQFLALDPWMISDDVAGTLTAADLSAHALTLADWASSTSALSFVRRDIFIVRTPDNKIGIASRNASEDALPMTLRFENHTTAVDQAVLENYRGTLVVPDATTGVLPDPTEDDFDNKRLATANGDLFNADRNLAEDHDNDATFTEVTGTTFNNDDTVDDLVNLEFGGVNHRFRGAVNRASDVANPAHNDVLVLKVAYGISSGWERYNNVAGSPVGWYNSTHGPDGWRGHVVNEAKADEEVTGNNQYFVYGGKLYVSSDYVAQVDQAAYIWVKKTPNPPTAIFLGRGQVEPVSDDPIVSVPFTAFPLGTNTSEWFLDECPFWRPPWVESPNDATEYTASTLEPIEDLVRVRWKDAPSRYLFGGEELGLFSPEDVPANMDPLVGYVSSEVDSDNTELFSAGTNLRLTHAVITVPAGVWDISGWSNFQRGSNLSVSALLRAVSSDTDDLILTAGFSGAVYDAGDDNLITSGPLVFRKRNVIFNEATDIYLYLTSQFQRLMTLASVNTQSRLTLVKRD